MRKTGSNVPSDFQGKKVDAFLPHPLPPADPVLEISPKLHALMEQASLALGRLDRLVDEFPDINLLIQFYQRKEAVLSSQIEGTVSTLSDLLLYEMQEKTASPKADAQENKNYVEALDFGIRRAKELPLSKRLLREVHEVLMQGVRGKNSSPGEFRKIQNAIANSQTGALLHVPPPPQYVEGCMDKLEEFLNEDVAEYPTLLKAALAHVQLETIHPFLDGNGRIGRLLITLILNVDGVLREPILYLSHYFKANQRQYYQMLNGVRTTGAWEEWVEFFYLGVRETAVLAGETALAIQNLLETDYGRVKAIGRSGQTALKTLELLKRSPFITAAKIATNLEVSLPTAITAVEHLVKLGILRQTDERDRKQTYAYEKYLSILNQGTTPTTIQ